MMAFSQINFRYPFLLALLIFSVACGDGIETEKDTTLEDPPITTPVTEEVPAIEQRMPFADEASRYFSNYFVHYRQYFPKMTFGDFIATNTVENATFHERDVEIEVDKWALTFSDYAFRSPNKQYWLDVVSYGVEKIKDGSWIAASPDSEVALIDTYTKQRTRLLFCGTACSFSEGFWLDDAKVVIAGLSAINKGYHPTLWYVDIPSRKIITYEYPEDLIDGQKAYSVLN